MEELNKALAAVLAAAPRRLVLSAPRPGQPQPALRRAAALPYKGGWQLETLTDTQAFHQNLSGAELPEALAQLLARRFTQLTAFTDTQVLALRVSKKGRVLQSHSPAKAVAAPPRAGARGHEGRRVLPEGEAIPPLVDVGILSAEGRPLAAKAGKWRQVNRFVELIDDAVESGALRPAAGQPLRVVDFGCGKSALSFVLYYYFTNLRGFNVEMTGLDLKAGVIAACNAAAEKYGYGGLHFEVGDIAGYAGAGADAVVSLHACDTATDLALAKAVQWGSATIFSVPCCQHELNAQMHSGELAILTRYGIVKERGAALFTDALRANLLGACGYKAQLVDLGDFGHSPKNIMIRAVKAGLPPARREALLDEARRLCRSFSLNPALWRLLAEAGLLPNG